MPKCPKCSHDKFAIEDITLDHDEYDLVAICCQACDCIIGITGPYNIALSVKNLRAEVQSLGKILRSYVELTSLRSQSAANQNQAPG